MIALNIEEGTMSMKRPYIYYGIMVFIIGILLGIVSTRMRGFENMLFTRKNRFQGT